MEVHARLRPSKKATGQVGCSVGWLGGLFFVAKGVVGCLRALLSDETLSFFLGY